MIIKHRGGLKFYLEPGQHPRKEEHPTSWTIFERANFQTLWQSKDSKEKDVYMITKEYISYRFVSSIPIELKGKIIDNPNNFEIVQNNENEIEIIIPIQFINKIIKMKLKSIHQSWSRRGISPNLRKE